jgi:4'-phosphopantetheinyl transferase
MLTNIQPDEIRVYYIKLESRFNIADLQRYLVDTEIIRADKFKVDEDRSRYIIGRAWLRKLLSSNLLIKPSEIQIIFNRFGKPAVNSTQNVNNLRFNLSNSGDWIIYSFCLNSETGIDIEKINPDMNHFEIAEQFCTQNELSYLKQSADHQQLTDRFFWIWTRKEALLKALGTGFTSDVKKYEVLNNNVSSKDNLHPEWTIMDIDVDRDYKAAAAFSGLPRKLIFEPVELLANKSEIAHQSI